MRTKILYLPAGFLCLGAMPALQAIAAVNIVGPGYLNVTSGAAGSPWHLGTAGSGHIESIAVGPGTGGWTTDLYLGTTRNDANHTTERVARLNGSGTEVQVLASNTQLQTASGIRYTPVKMRFGPGGGFGRDLFINDNNRSANANLIEGGLLRVQSNGAVAGFGSNYSNEPGAFAFAPANWRSPTSGFEAFLGELQFASTTNTLVRESDTGAISLFATPGGMTSADFARGQGFGTALYATVGNATSTSIKRIDASGTVSSFPIAPSVTKISSLAFPPANSGFGPYLYAMVSTANTATGGKIVRIDSSGQMNDFATGFNGIADDPISLAGGTEWEYADLAFSSTGDTLFVSDHTENAYKIVTNPTWNVDASGNWSAAGNWAGGVPNAIGATANFGSIILATRTVTVDAPQTVGSVNFSSLIAYNIVGPGVLTMDVSSGSANINVTAGSHTIESLSLADDTIVTVTPSSSTFAVTGKLVATGRTLTKAGAGVAQFENVRAAGLNIEAGTVKIRAEGTNNNAGGTVVVDNLAIAAGATLDLTNNSTIVDYTATSPIAALRDSIKIGFNNGSWTGTGITSSSAAVAAGTSLKTALGYAEASTLGITSFGGQTPDTTAVLVQYTLSGDANLDGAVNGLDFSALAGNFGVVTGKLWTQGDFNYDGLTDSLDFIAVAGNFNQTLPLSAPALGMLVPEPFSLVVPVALLLARRQEGRRLCIP